MKNRSGFFVRATARLAVAVIVLVLLTLNWTPVVQSVPGQPLGSTNWLLNPGFEAPFSDGVASGWKKWWDLSQEQNIGEPTFEERDATNSGDVHQGNSSQRVGSRQWMRHDGGLYQQISGLTVGHAASFSVWHKWPGDPHDGNQAVQLWIGLDPQGGDKADSGSVVWSDSTYATDAWQQMHLATTTLSTTVTVFLRSKTLNPYQPDTPLVEGYVLWDDAVVTSGPWQSAYLPLVARNYVLPCSLQNGGLEGDYIQWADGTRVAPHWSPWWNDDWDESNLRNAKPEYNDTTIFSDPAYRIRSGERSQQYGVTWKHYQGGLYQQLTSCTVSDTLRFSAYGLGFAARVMGSSSSDPDGELVMKVGIDPTGGTNFASDQVRWSEASVSLDVYRRFEVTATVQSPVVTVFLYSEPLHHSRQDLWFHNTSYWDDASLESLP